MAVVALKALAELQRFSGKIRKNGGHSKFSDFCSCGYQR